MRAGRVAAFASCLLAMFGCSAGPTTDPAPGPDSSSSPTSSTVEEPPPPTMGAVARSVQEAMDDYEDIATGAIVLVRVGDRTRVLTSGLSDVAADEPMSPDDRFPIQSITKSIVAAAVVQLVAEGALSLDDTVQEVYPGLLPQGSRITVRHLLSHRAGLHDPTDGDLPPLADMTQDTVVEIAADHPLEFTPGSEGMYSNAGFEVLGRIVERITGTSLGAALAEGIFIPAGMAHSRLGGTPSVQGYLDGKVAEDPYFPFVRGSGGVVSTVRDIDAFYTALFHGELLDPDLVETMTTSLGPATFADDYGLGIWINRESCGVAMGHSGAGPGFNTKAWTLQGTDRSVVVMVNDGDGYSIADALASAALCP